MSMYTVHICLLEYPPSRTFTMPYVLLGPFRILINFTYKFVRYLELHYLELSVRRTIFSAPSFIFGLFPIRFRMNHTVHFRHSNVNKSIDKTLFGSLFLLFFNIVQATTCPQLSENSV